MSLPVHPKDPRRWAISYVIRKKTEWRASKVRGVGQLDNGDYRGHALRYIREECRFTGLGWHVASQAEVDDILSQADVPRRFPLSEIL